MDDGLDIRQRRAVATSHSYPDTEPSTTTHGTTSTASFSPFPTLTSRWHIRRMNAPLPTRLGMRLLEILALALAMIAIPSLMQYGVRSINELYEIIGRRSRSPFASTSPTRILAGMLAFFVYHVVVVGLAYVAMGKQEERTSGRVIGEPNAETRRRIGPQPWLRIRSSFFLASYAALAGLWFFCRVAFGLLQPTYAPSKPDGGLEIPPATSPS